MIRDKIITSLNRRGFVLSDFEFWGLVLFLGPAVLLHCIGCLTMANRVDFWQNVGMSNPQPYSRTSVSGAGVPNSAVSLFSWFLYAFHRWHMPLFSSTVTELFHKWGKIVNCTWFKKACIPVHLPK